MKVDAIGAALRFMFRHSVVQSDELVEIVMDAESARREMTKARDEMLSSAGPSLADVMDSTARGMGEVHRQ